MFRLLRRFASRARSPRDRALRALALGRYARAAVLFGALAEAAATPRERAFALNKRGVARAGAGDRDGARADFEAALACDSACASAIVNLANQLLEAGEPEAAIARYREALRIDDEHAVAHLNLGIALKRVGRREEGVRELRRAQRLEGRATGRPTKRR